MYIIKHALIIHYYVSISKLLHHNKVWGGEGELAVRETNNTSVSMALISFWKKQKKQLSMFIKVSKIYFNKLNKLLFFGGD